MAIKKFKCEYYQLTQLIPNEGEALFDLEAWLSQISDLDFSSRTRPFKEDSVRLEEKYFHPSYNMWFLRFMRQRTNDVPSFSGKNIPSEFMELDDDQFVSEDVTCLYDPDNHVLMIQKNSHSVSPVGIEEYLNCTTPAEVTVYLRKVVATDSFKKVRKAKKCRKVIVRLADVKTSKERNLFKGLKSSIGQMVQNMDEVPSPFIEFTYSVGRDRGLEIDEDEVDKIVDDIESNPLLFDKAKLQVVEEKEVKLSFVDLFLDSPKDEISFNIKRNNPVRFEAIMDAMAQKYCPGENRENRKRNIDSYLRK
ncbi:TPA: DUF6731 family protein [Enterococcus faecalis]|nr:DUF6731 family protein [Enterococcus faecalis]EHD3774709.1 hypothetical protein [Enterococcus faecalis]EKE4873840.1 hypothetical protein [Enterococcus faecalis]EKZ0467752.1 hypothetical protein [Enterococcus faecalis]NSN15523.1 hypothetical protein [Enterococcus faecalis]PQF63536.1 hypothetical protein CUS74_09285 [Enterococcus faecalis]